MNNPSLASAFGQPYDPDQRRRNMLLQMLLHGTQQQSGPGQIGNALVSALLMNPGFGKALASAGSDIGNGIGNLVNGYQWNGTPGADMMNGLGQQAANNIQWGGPL